MQKAKVIQVMVHSTNVQLLCADERGLLSVYFEHQPFSLFNKVIHEAGLTLKGLQIEFNRSIVHVTVLHKTWNLSSSRKIAIA